jgi:hypothetical protein
VAETINVATPFEIASAQGGGRWVAALHGSESPNGLGAHVACMHPSCWQPVLVVQQDRLTRRAKGDSGAR